MIDLKDLTGLMKGSKRICDSVAQNIIASLIKVTVNEISSELRELGTDYVGQKTGGAGAPAAKAILTDIGTIPDSAELLKPSQVTIVGRLLAIQVPSVWIESFAITL